MYLLTSSHSFTFTHVSNDSHSDLTLSFQKCILPFRFSTFVSYIHSYFTYNSHYFFFSSSFGFALRNAEVFLLLYYFSSALFCVRTVTKALIKKMNEEHTWKEWNEYRVHIAHTQMDMDMKWKWKWMEYLIAHGLIYL